MTRRLPSLGCVVLAAGASTRLGAPKQLARYRGRPLLLHALDAAGAAVDGPVVAVLGAHAGRLRALLARRRVNARIVVNRDWRTGIAGSLAAGLAALPPRVAAALVVLVDQPAVGAPELQRLVAAWRRRPGVAAAACYDGRAGVPAILPRRLWRAVRALDGDQGARAVLRGLDVLTLVPLPEAALDLDTPADLERLRGGGAPNAAQRPATVNVRASVSSGTV